jgi:hypothetical protein
VISPTEIPLADNKQHSQETDLRSPGEIPTRNPNKQAAAVSPVRPRGTEIDTFMLLNARKSYSDKRREESNSYLEYWQFLFHFSEIKVGF